MGGFVHVHHGEAELPVAGAGRRMGQVEGGAELGVLAVEHALRLSDEAPVAGARAAGVGRVVWTLGQDAHGVALAEEVRAGQVCRHGRVGVGDGGELRAGREWQTEYGRWSGGTGRECGWRHIHKRNNIRTRLSRTTIAYSAMIMQEPRTDRHARTSIDCCPHDKIRMAKRMKSLGASHRSKITKCGGSESCLMRWIQK
jgi:hypothetical protein